MNKLLAFTNCTESKAAAIASAKRHVELDLLRQRTYGDDAGHGCSISCHYGANNHAAAPAKHGFSARFVYLCDRLFEAQPDKKSAQEFHVWVMENVAIGADTMRIWWEFFAITIEGIGPEWAKFAAECRVDNPDLEKLVALALARARDRDLARDTKNFKKAVLKFAEPEKIVSL